MKILIASNPKGQHCSCGRPFLNIPTEVWEETLDNICVKLTQIVQILVILQSKFCQWLQELNVVNKQNTILIFQTPRAKA